jgi:hypothetical protein
MSDDQIEAMIRDLIEINLDEDARAAHSSGSTSTQSVIQPRST